MIESYAPPSVAAVPIDAKNEEARAHSGVRNAVQKELNRIIVALGERGLGGTWRIRESRHSTVAVQVSSLR